MPSCYFFPRLECFTPDSLMEIRCDKVFQNPYLKLYLDHMPIWPLKKLAWDCHSSKFPKMISRASLYRSWTQPQTQYFGVTSALTEMGKY